MQRKDVTDHFVSELRDHFGEKILGIYLFGSTAKGTATSESDIDVYEGKTVRECEQKFREAVLQYKKGHLKTVIQK